MGAFLDHMGRARGRGLRPADLWPVGVCERHGMRHPWAMQHRLKLAMFFGSLLATSSVLGACNKAEPEREASASKIAADKAAAQKGTKTGERPSKEGAAAKAAASRGTVIDHEVTDIEGNTVKLSDYRDKALLIVNTASQCGFTPQYAKLQELYGLHKDKGLVVLGFPSNDYGGQEPGTNEDISKFVASKFSVEFPMMDKVSTSGDEMVPLYRALTKESPENMQGPVRWNFTKFLVDKEGYVVARFESPEDPLSDAVQGKIMEVLGAGEAGAASKKK